MARGIFIAALCAALLATPGWAQRGGHGGMSMGGGRGGHSGGGGYAVHGGGYGHVPSYGGAPHAGAYWGGSRGWGGGAWNGGAWHGSYPYRYPYHPWGYRPWGYGYAGWGGYPWWGWYGGLGWYDSSYYADNWYTAQTYPSYVYVTPGDSNGYSRAYQVQQVPAARPESKTAETHAETVLIYRDGHAEEVENYAIVGKTIWVFNEERAKKIPLADLDLPATKRDNEDRGIDFVLPNSSR